LSFSDWINGTLQILPATFIGISFLQLNLQLTKTDTRNLAEGRAFNNILGVAIIAIVLLCWCL
jgi:hypothetical protein